MPPILHGLEFCRIIKGAPATQAIPIIMLTALASQDDKLKGFKMGAVGMSAGCLARIFHKF